MNSTRNDLPLSVRQTVIPMLQARLVDSIDLQTQIKQAHWNVKGPSFYSLHKLFDEAYEVIEEASDEIAERIVALGGRADGTARVVASSSTLKQYPLDITDGMAHVHALADALATFGRQVRGCIDPAAGAGDADTADLFTGVSRDVDKMLWFVEAHAQA